VYPWGNVFECHRGNFDDETEYNADVVPGGAGCDGYVETAPVGHFGSGASWCGALDLSGNVREWCADWYDEDYYSESPARNPGGPDSGMLRVSRGGWWNGGPWPARCARRYREAATARYGSNGFRVALSGP
jgi:formylglycine-generating enzyme required for sulfatase activity